jgi:hypothetical protein
MCQQSLLRYERLESRVKQAEVYSRALLDNALRTQDEIDQAFEGNPIFTSTNRRHHHGVMY